MEIKLDYYFLGFHKHLFGFSTAWKPQSCVKYYPNSPLLLEGQSTIFYLSEYELSCC